MKRFHTRLYLYLRFIIFALQFLITARNIKTYTLIYWDYKILFARTENPISINIQLKDVLAIC